MLPISPNLQNFINNHLQAFEKIMWSSAPRRSRLIRRSIETIIFGAAWIAFCSFAAVAGRLQLMEWMKNNDSYGYAGWILPILFALLGLIGFRWLLEPFVSYAYVVTSQRALIVERSILGKVQIIEYLPHEIAKLHVRLVQQPNGDGDLMLDQHADFNDSDQTVEIGFLGIAQVKEVEALVLSLAKPHDLSVSGSTNHE